MPYILFVLNCVLCATLKNDRQPFGGVNMIFARDFAQLPPSMGESALYDYQVRHIVHTTNSHFK